MGRPVCRPGGPSGTIGSPPDRPREPPIDAFLDPAHALDERKLLDEPRPSIAGPWRWVGFAAATLIAASAPLWRLAGAEWRFSLPFVPHDGQKPFTTWAFLISAGLLALSWVMLVRRVERSAASERARTRAVVITLGLWFVPVLLGPPLLSSDIYSYAAQGEMVTRGLDPTAEGMYKLRTGEYVNRTDPLWRTPVVGNGYGPVQMGAAAAAVYVSGHDVNGTIWALRVIALLGVALAGWGLLQIARDVGLDPPTSLALGLANPIVILHVVGGGHNDGLLIGLLLAGIALTKRHWWWGVALIAMAAAVKAPAVAALPYLAWVRPGVKATVKERITSMAQAGAAALGVIVAWSLAVGVSFGWINSMRNAGSSKDTLSIMTQVGFLLSEGMRSIGIPADVDWWVGALRLVGMGTIGVAALWLLWHTERFGALRAAAIASLAMVLLGPVVWPWYLTASIVLLAVVDLGRWRPSLFVLVTALSCEVFPSSTGGKGPSGNHLLAGVTIGGIAAAAILLPFVPGWWEALKERSAARQIALAD